MPKVAESKLYPSKSNINQLHSVIIKSIQEKKGEKLVSLDLSKVEDAITDRFVICEAPSTTQVKAISDNIIKVTKEELGENPWHVEGLKNTEWVLLDFVNIVVHVFHKEKRAFYQLEELWSDAKLTEYKDE